MRCDFLDARNLGWDDVSTERADAIRTAGGAMDAGDGLVHYWTRHRLSNRSDDDYAAFVARLRRK